MRKSKTRGRGKSKAPGRGRAVAVRTFAAKYMHFHNRLVPIYDNVNANKLKSLYPLKKLRSEMPKNADREHVQFVERLRRDSKMPKYADREYFQFVERLRRLARELNVDLCGRHIRDLDHYLRVL